MKTFNEPLKRPKFSELEDQITKYWLDNAIFEKSIEIRKDAQDYIFYDGPPFMSGMPHYAHLLSSIAKDIIPRYQAMKGRKVERVWGWDCHGLPIENKVEQQLNLKGTHDIEAYGLDKFIEKCYEWNRVGIENWKWYIEKIGRWVDMENAYRTMDQDYMESVWWVFKQIWDKGYIYKGLRTSLYSTDFCTPVSDFEVTMDTDNYRDTEDIAVTVKFKLTDESHTKLTQLVKTDLPIYLLAWTTTPWTLPSNFALAVNPDGKYIAVEQNNEVFVIIKERLEAVFGKDETNYKVISEIKPSQLEGLEYNQLMSFLEGGPNDFKVYLSEYVTTEEGTGVLHVAPAFGEADFEMGKAWDLSFAWDIDPEGKLIVGPWEGIYLRDANPQIIEYMKEQNILFKEETYVHRLPYYRGANPLIYKTQVDYFVNITKIKDQLISSNKEINWIPEYFKEGRFQNSIETAPDWSISRTRYWGTVMPLWQSEDEEQIVIGSRDELMEYVNKDATSNKIQKVLLNLDEKAKLTESDVDKLVNDFKGSSDAELKLTAAQKILSYARNKYLGETDKESVVKPLGEDEVRAYYLFNGKPLDLHRPYIDEVTFEYNGKKFTRVDLTLDVWMDSGSMPFAQFHYPFVNKEKFEESFPGDYISEYTGQIRAWFYVLHVISNAVFDKPAFKNVLVSGVMLGEDGRKMSKVFGNYPDPKDTLMKYGGDALRMYLMSSPIMSGENMNFSEKDLSDQLKSFFIPLWNIYTYIVTYGKIHNWTPSKELITTDNLLNEVTNEMDVWMLNKLQVTTAEANKLLDSYLLPKYTRVTKELIQDISKWYIRRSRDRFADGDVKALETLYYVLVNYLKLIAPVTPFIAEYLYQELATSVVENIPASVHLNDYPKADENFVKTASHISEAMDTVKEVTELGHSIRTNNGIGLRQPLATIQIKLSQELPTWAVDLIKDELNIKNIELVEVINQQEGWITNENTQASISIDTNISDELKAEGQAREFMRSIQAERKNQKLNLNDVPTIEYFTENQSEIAMLEQFKEEIESNTQTKLTLNEKVNSIPDRIEVKKTNIVFVLVK